MPAIITRRSVVSEERIHNYPRNTQTPLMMQMILVWEILEGTIARLIKLLRTHHLKTWSKSKKEKTGLQPVQIRLMPIASLPDSILLVLIALAEPLLTRYISKSTNLSIQLFVTLGWHISRVHTRHSVASVPRQLPLVMNRTTHLTNQWKRTYHLDHKSFNQSQPAIFLQNQLNSYLKERKLETRFFKSNQESLGCN